MTYECPTCGRVTRDAKPCKGTQSRPHALREVVEAGHLSEALDVREPVRVADDRLNLRDG